MVLSVRKDSLVSSNKVDNKILLDNLLSDSNIKWIEEKEEEYIPLVFAISVRSLETNRIVQCVNNEVNGRVYFATYSNLILEHRGFDLAMFMSSLALNHCFKTDSEEFRQLMFKYSSYLCMGAYYSSSLVLNPILYSQIYLKDESIPLFEKFLKDGFSFIDIDNINKKANLKAILNTIKPYERRK